MRDDFDKKIKNLEREILDLKTACEYTSVRSSSITNSQVLNTGNYQVTFDNDGDEIMSMFFVNDPTGQHFGSVFALPPQGSTQTLLIDATDYQYSGATVVPVNFNVRLTAISNYPITNIVKIS